MRRKHVLSLRGFQLRMKERIDLRVGFDGEGWIAHLIIIRVNQPYDDKVDFYGKGSYEGRDPRRRTGE